MTKKNSENWLKRLENADYLTIILVFSFVLSVSVAIPELCADVFKNLGWLSYSDHAIALVESRAFRRIVRGLIAVFLISSFILLWTQRNSVGWRKKIILSPFILSSFLLSPIWLHHWNEVRNLQKERISNFPKYLKNVSFFQMKKPDGDAFLLALDSNISTVRNMHDFFAAIENRYLLIRENLSAIWNTNDDRLLRGYFYMNFVSNYWNFGNKKNPDQPGCVLRNEERDGMSDGYQNISFSDFLDSEIACCTDFAATMKVLFDFAGIPNQLVTIPGHIFNEIETRSGKVTLDASINVAFHSSWEQMMRRNPDYEKLEISSFVHNNMKRHNTPHYRDAVGQFRFILVQRAIHGADQDFSYSMSLPEEMEPLFAQSAP